VVIQYYWGLNFRLHYLTYSKEDQTIVKEASKLQQ